MGTETELESLVVRLVGDGRDYDRMISRAVVEIERASTIINTHAKKIQAAGKLIRNTGLKMTAAVSLPVVGMIKSFSSFDDAMTQSTAIMGNVSADMRKEMETTARTISLSTNKSAVDLAQSYFYLASAGMDAAQSISALPVVEKFATAGSFDMARATDLLTDAQSALGLSSKDAEQNMIGLLRVSDTLVKANTLANASVEQFSEALTNEAGAAIKQYNMDLNESVAILATYADRGIKGNVAGSMFGRMTRLLIKSINDNRDAFEKLNIPIDEFANTGKNVTGVIEGITKATEGLGPVQKAATLEALGFEARIQQAILPLLGATDKIKDYEKALKEAGGVTKEVADKQLQSFGSQMKIVWNYVIDFANDIGRILAPYIKKIGDFIKGLADEWRGLGEETKKAIGIIIGITAALGPVLTVIGSIMAAASGLVVVMSAAFAPSAIAAFAASLPGVLAAVLSISTAIAAVGAGLKYAIDLGKIKENEKKQKELAAINKEMRELISLQNDMKNIVVRQTQLKAKGHPAFDPNELEQANSNIKTIKDSIKELNEESSKITESTVSPIKEITKASDEVTNSIINQNKTLAEEDSSWEYFGKVLEKTSDTNKRRLELIKSSNDAIKKENERQLQEDIARDKEYRRLVENATIAELGNIKDAVQRELAIHEYKYERLKELYEEGSQELVEIERAAAAERIAILNKNDYWGNYLLSMENNMKNMDSVVGDSLSNWTSQFGNFFASAIMDSENLEDAFKSLGHGMVSTMLSAIGQMIAQWLVYKATKIATDKATQAAAAPAIVSSAQAGSLLAGINAYASAAAIPITGWAMAPGAMAAALAATQPMAAAIAGLTAAGMAHEGINRIPETGTWLLEKGERVLTQDTSAKLDATLDYIRSNMNGNNSPTTSGGAGASYHLHNNYNGPVFLNRAQMRDASRMFMNEMERERTRRGAVA